MAQYKQSYFNIKPQKQLYVQEWFPEKEPTWIILYVHGLGSHSGRLDHWGERFADKGIGFIAYDQRGHGRSFGKRGRPVKFQYLVDDLNRMVEWLRLEHPEKKILLYGHSMGGSVAINYVISKTYTADALITTSPWLRLVKPPPALLIRLIRPIKRIIPTLTLKNGLDPKDISTRQEEVDKYASDPLVHNKISLGLFFTALEAGYHALRNVYKINCPFLIMHGNADRITSWKASEEFVMNTSDRTQLRIWENAAHELHHDAVQDEVFDAILQWHKGIQKSKK